MVQSNEEGSIWGPLFTFLGVVAVAAAALWLWRFDELRPYTVTALSLAAALIGPISSQFPEKTRGKWLIFPAIAAVVGGSWFAAKGMDEALNKAKDQNAQIREDLRKSNEEKSSFEMRLAELEKSVGGVVRSQSADCQDSFLLRAGQYEKTLYAQKRFLAISDSADTLLEVDPDNGHGLYYKAEAIRSLKSSAPVHQGRMRDALQKYRDAASRHPEESKLGDREMCYKRASGFCLERYAWVNHLLALENLNSALASTGPNKVSALGEAFRYARDELQIWEDGFRGEAQTPSTCGILKIVSAELKKAGEDIQPVDNYIQAHEKACKL